MSSLSSVGRGLRICYLTCVTVTHSSRYRALQPSGTLGVRSRSTIFNIASGHGKCGVSVIRVSGPASRTVLHELTMPTRDSAVGPQVVPRKAVYHKFRHPKTGDILDKGLMLWFPGPASFTGEDVVEFHVHGGVAVVEAMLKAISEVSGTRVSEPGEFAQRAFMNGKLDLVEIEGLANLIDAETETQRKVALRLVAGELSHTLNAWKTTLKQSLAQIEAALDFGEEQHLSETELLSRVLADCLRMTKDAKILLSQSTARGKLIQEGIRIAILGPANAGKSSLLNRLCAEDLAMVSSVPGTTRDVITGRAEFWGNKVLILDTAGQRGHSENVDELEVEGMMRGIRVAEDADLILLVLDVLEVAHHGVKKILDQIGFRLEQGYLMHHGRNGSVLAGRQYIEGISISARVSSLPIPKSEVHPNGISIEESVQFVGNDGRMIPAILVLNKSDLLSSVCSIGDLVHSELELVSSSHVVCMSCITNDGFGDLLTSLKDRILAMTSGASVNSAALLTRERQREHVEQFVVELEAFVHSLQEEEHLDIAAQHIKRAAKHLGALTGEITTEDILSAIFSQFCIGK